ncbi:CD2-associated protein [Nematolebias whitei]|uniref:CD2-associated protein n=1 Tax=Nematolebias whitei TaxID=451745 RepID=UPI001898392E|nr:CD2-associated protein [Nematolebias whitei]
MEVVVEFEYESLHEDELTLRLGDIIKNVRYIEEEGWMEGELDGKKGVFPDNFVKVVKKETANELNKTAEPPKKEPSNVANLVKRMSHIGIPIGGFQPPPPAASKKLKKRQCKAVFEYQPLNEDELELKLGDIIEITEEVEEGWWSGTVNGKSGLFPSNFVEELETTGEEPEPKNTSANVTDGGGTEVVTTPTSPQPASGSDPLRHPPKGPRLGFGDIFKDGSGKLKPKVNNQTEETNPQIPSLPSAAKPAHPTMNDAHREEVNSKPKAAAGSSAKEYCKVTFPYEAKNEDELTLKDGEIVRILSKDTGEPGWWRGEVGANSGVFPNNFVTVVLESEKEAPAPRGSGKSSQKPDLEHKISFPSETPIKPIKPPPPSKQPVHKPEVPSAEKKPPPPIKPTEKADKFPLELKPSKPPPPTIPTKKPVPLPPKKPEKPVTSTPSFRQNGEVLSTRLKSEVEPVLPPVPKPQAGDAAEKPSESVDLKIFDELSMTSEKLPHPTANRPKFHGRRLPARVGEVPVHSPTRDVNFEKVFKNNKEDGAEQLPTETRKPTRDMNFEKVFKNNKEDGAEQLPTETRKPTRDVNFEKSFKNSKADGAKQSPTETRKPPTSILSQSPPLHRVTEARPGIAAALSSDVDVSQSIRARLEPDGPNVQLDEFRSQVKELLLTVERLKAQQMKEIAELRGELYEERQKRLALQMEVEELKRAIHLT